MLNRAFRYVPAWASAAVLTAGTAWASQPPSGKGEFVPVGSAPAIVESLPAAPLLIAAYAFVWVALLGYVWFLWRRMKTVQDEIQTLERRAGQRGGGA